MYKVTVNAHRQLKSMGRRSERHILVSNIPSDANATAETAFNLLSLADEFRSSGNLLMRSSRFSIGITPQYYLVCHGIELALKSFLRAHGFNASRLKKLGHALGKCLGKAQQCGLASIVTLTKNEIDNLRLIDRLYHAKELEYNTSGGTQHFPDIAVIYGVLDKILNGIRNVCLESTK